LQGIGTPLDVTLVVQQTRVDGAGALDSFNRELRDIEGALRIGDALEVVSTGSQGRLLRVGSQTTQRIQPVRDNGRCEAVYDVLVRALVRPPVEGRHRVVI